MAKEKYQISLWADDFITENGISYYKERKIAIIGSDTMTASCRAMEPQLVENINGTNQFTFKVFYTCHDDTFEDLVRQFCVQPSDLTFQDSQDLLFLLRSVEFTQNTYTNPFLSLLVNERKVKVYWKNKWYDLIIKNCQEDSSQKTITYTCTDAYINELSKTGFDIELDTKLNNNTGTVTELAATILENTDWTVDVEGSDLLQQTREEAVYEVQALSTFNAYDEELNTTVTIPSGATLLKYRSPMLELASNLEDNGDHYYLQFGYSTTYEQADEGDQIVSEAHCCSIDNIAWVKGDIQDQIYPYPDYSNELSVRIIFMDPSQSALLCSVITLPEYLSTRYRANRLVRTQRTMYDSLTNKYCELYEAIGDLPSGSGSSNLVDTGDIIYKYKEIQYRDPTTVNNLIVNNRDFTSVEGWVGQNLTFRLYGLTSSGRDFIYPKSYLYLSSSSNVYNSGLRYLSNYIPNGFAQEEKYIFRYKAMTDNNSSPSGTYIGLEDASLLIPYIVNFIDDGYGNITIGDDFYFSIDSVATQDNWIEYTMTCSQSTSRASIYSDNIGIILTIGNQNLWLEQAEFFPLVYGEPEHVGDPAPRIDPGQMNIISVAATYYCYYNYTKSRLLVNPEDIVYIYHSTEDLDFTVSPGSILRPIYNENFEKIRTISAKQSNRYNLLQKLAETFECWIEFNVEHLDNAADGSIVYVNGTPQKSVRFKKENGQKTGIGFVYGIDLNTIQRTIQSDQIVTKMVVNPNKNEFAKDGFCTIARSRENPSHNNFILNFDYYISQNLINKEQVRDHLDRYYLILGWLSNTYNYNAEKEASLQTIYLKQKSYLTLYNSAIESAEEQKMILQSELINLLNKTSWDEVLQYIEDNFENLNDEVESRFTAICSLQNSLEIYTESYQELEQSIADLEIQINLAISSEHQALNNIKSLHLWFYKIYSRFIQEGTWIDESYMDDNLYYLDALKNTRISSRPQVSYTISVLRLSSLEDFKYKIFHLGDIAYIQDTEFFGYTDINGVKTPYRETVLLSEITSNFEEPEKDTFKVQNYKTDFEDLFQRINSASQDFHYQAGGYNRINSTIEPDGRLRENVLQKSLNNSNLVYSTANKQMIQAPNEFIVSDIVNINKKTKITPGGIFITENGGETWKNAVNASGLQQQAIAKNNNVNISSEGIKLAAVEGTKGIVYEGGKVQGLLHTLVIENETPTRALDASDKITIDNDEIWHYYCENGQCFYGGKIKFSPGSGVGILARSKGITRFDIKDQEIDMTVDSGGLIKFNAAAMPSNNPSLSIDLYGGKMVYSYYDSTTSSMVNSVLNLKTFIP